MIEAHLAVDIICTCKVCGNDFSPSTKHRERTPTIDHPERRSRESGWYTVCDYCYEATKEQTL